VVAGGSAITTRADGALIVGADDPATFEHLDREPGVLPAVPRASSGEGGVL
jgi:hypothetical protein